MRVKKFKGYNKGYQMRDEDVFNINELKTKVITGFDMYLQYLGIEDANKKEMYEGDVLELKITDGLMDHNKSLFFNSNLGKLCEKDREITSVILVADCDTRELCVTYLVYFCHNGCIDRNDDGEVEYATSGNDFMFPEYLCQKGAVIVGNVNESPNILTDMWGGEKENVQQ